MHFHKWIEFKDDNNMYYRFCMWCERWQKQYGYTFWDCKKPDIKSLVVVDNEAEEWEQLMI